VVVDYVRLYLDRSGPNFTTAELWTEVKGDLGRVFATAFGLGLIVAAVYLIVIVVALLRSEFLIVLAVLAVLGVFFYMYVPLSLIFTVRLCEDDGFWASISRCFELVKGNWWKTFGVFIVLNTIVNVVSGIFLFPAQMFMYLIEFGAVESGSGGMKLVITILLMVGMVAAYLLAAVPALGATLQYFNLVEKHESVGLMGRIESMGDATANDNTF
jgi:hypothetical protein